MIFSGTAIREDLNNPDNVDAAAGFPPITTYFPGTYTDCQAVQACADATALNPGQQYLSFGSALLEINRTVGVCLVFAATNLRFVLHCRGFKRRCGLWVFGAGCRM
jgi:hypothetical protein